MEFFQSRVYSEIYAESFATNRALHFTISIPSLVCLGVLCFKTDYNLHQRSSGGGGGGGGGVWGGYAILKCVATE